MGEWQIGFRFEQAEKAIEMALQLNEGKSALHLDEFLIDAKKIYDFMVGESHHFNDGISVTKD